MTYVLVSPHTLRSPLGASSLVPLLDDPVYIQNPNPGVISWPTHISSYMSVAQTRSSFFRSTNPLNVSKHVLREEDERQRSTVRHECECKKRFDACLATAT
ncbi:hypothetical protein M3J09_009356 [Ascochyta lentis]